MAKKKFASPFVFLSMAGYDGDDDNLDVVASGTNGLGEDEILPDPPASFGDYALKVGADLVGAPGTDFADQPDGIVDFYDYSAYMENNFPGYPLVND